MDTGDDPTVGAGDQAGEPDTDRFDPLWLDDRVHVVDGELAGVELHPRHRGELHLDGDRVPFAAATGGGQLKGPRAAFPLHELQERQDALRPSLWQDEMHLAGHEAHSPEFGL